MPTGVQINPDLGSHQKDILPGSTGNRLGHMAERIIFRREALGNDFERDGYQHSKNHKPEYPFNDPTDAGFFKKRLRWNLQNSSPYGNAR